MFKMPPITKNLLVVNVLLFLAMRLLLNNGIDLNDILGLHFFKSDSFMPYQLITYMFMHANFEHIFFNMLAFWMFGRVLEQVWGPRKYLLFYLVCGVGAGLCQELVQYIEYTSQHLDTFKTVTDGTSSMPMSEYLNLWTTVGASGAVYGILLGFGMTFPNERILLLIPPMPLKAKYLVIGYAVIELLSGLGSSGSNVAHFAHLGGMLFGLGLILYWRHKAGVGRNGFSTWQEYKPKQNMWTRMKVKSTQGFSSKSASSKSKSSGSSNKIDDPYADELSRRRARQAEVDRILDKVKKSGYGCLTDEEKKTIFDFRNK
ncbi:MAG: rhomboid family intramembrane serine protease [Bacteroidaceae bacterium]|nr:rhomboid family intramembrane serine protease [Bacteroidaceae bacterium]